jgi:GH15 family glucan-1,4-alpha-glucosidase
VLFAAVTVEAKRRGLNARSQACVGSPEPCLQGGVVPDRYPVIEDHAVAGNLHTAALVATDETIDWYCLPQFDLPAVFASLLDADRGGSFAVQCEAAPDQAVAWLAGEGLSNTEIAASCL